MTAPTHQQRWLAAGLRRAARTHGTELPIDYSLALATDPKGAGDPLGVTRLGDGVVIHTAPERRDRLPIILGYSDRTGCWDRQGHWYSSRSAREPRPPGQRTIAI